MARTVLTVQPLNAQTGITPAWTPVDTVNGMQYRNTGVQVVACVTGTGSSVILAFRSTADAYGRTGDVIVLQQTPAGVVPLTKFYGPFNPTTIWGDGASQNFIDASALAGTASVVVISI